MSRTALVYHPSFLEHDNGPGHPESPARLQTVLEHCEQTGVAAHCLRLEPVAASVEAITRVHAPEHVRYIASRSDLGRLVAETPDTLISPGTYQAALMAAGGVITAVDAVMDGSIDNAFCMVRPPGHHAELDQAFGFCYFNNIAIAARHLRVVHGLQRVAIVDFDVHHGNGTQHSFEADASVFFFSVHQYSPGFFPGTGAREERGSSAGRGSTLNAPLPPGCGDSDYKRVFREHLRPAMDQFKPEFLLVSAGFDAHRSDPLAGMELTTSAYEPLTRALVDLAADHCQGRLVSVLEGGYHLRALAESAGIHLQVLLG